MQLLYPALAALSCDRCQREMVEYDWSTHTGSTAGKRLADGSIMKRPVPPPCMNPDGTVREGGCPKEAPGREALYVLSDRNQQTFDFYREVQATAGACLTDAMREDRLLMRNLAYVHEVATAVKQREQSSSAAAVMVSLFGRGRK